MNRCFSAKFQQLELASQIHRSNAVRKRNSLSWLISQIEQVLTIDIWNHFLVGEYLESVSFFSFFLSPLVRIENYLFPKGLTSGTKPSSNQCNYIFITSSASDPFRFYSDSNI